MPETSGASKMSENSKMNKNFKMDEDLRPIWAV